jgi:hypothetical protein
LGIIVIDNKKNAIQEQITFSTNPEFNAYAWRTPEVISFKRKMESVNEIASQNKTAPIKRQLFCATYLQNAHNYYTYHREYMFHNL